jgi:hypothetical protein
MEKLTVADTVKRLTAQRDQTKRELAALEQALALLRGLTGQIQPPGGQKDKHPISVAGRKRIAQAQRIRWAKFRQERAAKAKAAS